MANIAAVADSSPVTTAGGSASAPRRARMAAMSPDSRAAADGPGSLLNQWGHPVERLTPNHDVPNLRADAD
jgi:hypothetical protein